MSVQSIYAHKKQFYYSLGMGTHADEGVLYLARQGTKAIEFPLDQPPQIDDKKTLFWLCDVDDALTAQIYQTPENSALDGKVFRIWISHQRHYFEGLPPVVPDTDIMIYSMGSASGACVVHFGKRAQGLQMLLAPTLHWGSFPVIKTFDLRQENKSWVEQVEKNQWAGGVAFFEKPGPRIYDRALLVWKNCDASAIRDLLIQDHKVSPSHLEAFSLSRWNETKLIGQFEKRGYSSDVFRGALVISAELAKDTGFQKKIESVVSTLQKMSSF